MSILGLYILTSIYVAQEKYKAERRYLYADAGINVFNSHQSKTKINAIAQV